MGNPTVDTKTGALDYAGDISAQEAWEQLQQKNNTHLVDVRTPEEWSQIGTPDLSSINKSTILISWRLKPDMHLNNNFQEQLRNNTNINSTDNIFFICRSGSRSLDAAIETTKQGYKHCYNITGGFEGKTTNNHPQHNTNGWQASNLPWEHKQL